MLPELVSLWGIELQQASLSFCPALSLSVGIPCNVNEKSVIYCRTPAAHFPLQISSLAPWQLWVCLDVYMCMCVLARLFPLSVRGTSFIHVCRLPLPTSSRCLCHTAELLPKCHCVVTGLVMTIFGWFFTGLQWSNGSGKTAGMIRSWFVTGFLTQTLFFLYFPILCRASHLRRWRIFSLS